VSAERVDILVIGGGQAGLSLSYYLTQPGRDHAVLEQDRVAESWRSRRRESQRLDWLHTAKSGLFVGISEDAAHLAAVMATEHATNATPVQ
jgi:glycine/D-amino acid oxidase-like deaminating enzyme